MRIKKSASGREVYMVKSSKPGKYWKRTCNCPHFVFRLRKTGEVCKHIHAVEKMLHNESKDDFEKAIMFVKKKGKIDSVQLIEKFGEGLVNELIDRGELLEKNGKIIVVE